MQKIADYFNVSVDYLLGHETFLTSRDKKDIDKIMEQTREQLMNQEGLMINRGVRTSPEAIDSILSAMQIGMELSKKIRKNTHITNIRRD